MNPDEKGEPLEMSSDGVERGAEELNRPIPHDPQEMRELAASMRETLDAAAERIERLEGVARDLIDPNPCRFDHRGGCQEHGYLWLQPGELCPHQETKELLALHPQTKEESK